MNNPPSNQGVSYGEKTDRSRRHEYSAAGGGPPRKPAKRCDHGDSFSQKSPSLRALGFIERIFMADLDGLKVARVCMEHSFC